MREFRCNICGTVRHTLDQDITGWRHPPGQDEKVCMGRFEEIEARSDEELSRQLDQMNEPQF